MEKDMTKGRPLPVILKFMLPLIIGNIFQQLYNMADTIIVGRYVGADALAAVGSTGTIMFLTVGFSQGITAGFSVLTAQRFGAKDTEGVKISVANGILLSLIFTVIISSLSLLGMRPLLKLMNTPDNIFQDAYTYIMIISAGIIATIFYNLFSSYLRAVGNSKIPLVFLVFSAALNVILDLVLIINFKMGVAGAAWATIISQGVSAILCLVYIYIRMPSLAPNRRHWRLRLHFRTFRSFYWKPDPESGNLCGQPAGYGNSYGIAVCNYSFRYYGHAICHQSFRFRCRCLFYGSQQGAEPGNPGNDGYGTDYGDI